MRCNFRLAALPLLVAVMSRTVSMFCQAADLLDRIKEKKEIVIASEARYAPFEMWRMARSSVMTSTFSTR